MSGQLVRGRNLPHWDVPGAAYFVTTCLEGSIPAQGLLDIARDRGRLEEQNRPTDISQANWTTRLRKLSFARTDEWLDHRPAVRHLADPKLAKIVVDALHFFVGQRYDLLSYVVMPSHFHWVFRPRMDWIETLESSERSPRQRILHAINRHTALECNRLLGTTGQFWQHEPYDHWVRDSDELERIVLYVESNPVEAQLVDSAEKWPFSSAFRG